MERKDDPIKSVNDTELTSDAGMPEDILRKVKDHLRSGKHREAYFVIQDAALEYPDNPFILSYHGWLQALLDRRYRPGVDKCKMALSMIQKEATFGEEKLYPLFYLNLGRAYVAAGKKKEALESFDAGLNYDKRNREILQELKALGSRKKALVPFLDRSNPINKYVGLILHPAKKGTTKKK
jgi:tetratricopeptide (TPR) repeat protein